MLPKELFLSTLEKIQKQEARIDEFNTALSKICDGFPVFDSENQYLIALRELLKYTMQDQYDYIGWWLYEAPDAGYGQADKAPAFDAGTVGSNPTIPAMIRYSRGLREQLAKLLFVGSNPTRISIWCLRLIGEDASLSSL